jgi:hypothetical protein
MNNQKAQCTSSVIIKTQYGIIIYQKRKDKFKLTINYICWQKFIEIETLAIVGT